MVTEYRQFFVKAFEREPGKWRASVERADGKVLLKVMVHRRRTLDKFVTGVDAIAAEEAMAMAIAAIDANAFSRISNKDEYQASDHDRKPRLLNRRTSSHFPLGVWINSQREFLEPIANLNTFAIDFAALLQLIAIVIGP